MDRRGLERSGFDHHQSTQNVICAARFQRPLCARYRTLAPRLLSRAGIFAGRYARDGEKLHGLRNPARPKISRTQGLDDLARIRARRNSRLNARALAAGAFVWRMGGCVRPFRIIRAGLDGRDLFSRKTWDRRVQFQDCRINQSIWSRVFKSNEIAWTNRDPFRTRKYSHHRKASARRMGIDSGNRAIARLVIPSVRSRDPAMLP